MGNKALENRINKLKALEDQKKSIENEMDKLKAEIKADMEHKGVEEIKTGNFIIRLTKVITNRFDGKRFEQEHKKLYEQYMKKTESRRFSIV
ncbi:MAG: siphovirus Gp157 family protein [Lachnospiraceae bacterium]|nr:siphovirus Gp157 family protein [Lachnospiraceae bacterium]